MNIKRKKLKKRSDDSLKNKLSYYLTKGLNLEEACILCDCTSKQLMELRNDFEFENFIQKAILSNKSDHLQSIKTASLDGVWQASAWYLERAYPDEFGKRDIVRHEYQIKLQTFQQTILKVINEVDPKLKFKIVSKLKGLNFDGQCVMDQSFQQLPPPSDEDNGDD